MESASGLSRYVVAMYIANQVLAYDEQDDQVYAQNVDALTVFLREAGATHEDAAYRFIDSINKSHLPCDTIVSMIQQSVSDARTTVIAPEYVLETQIMVFVARDEISAARKIARRMESCTWLDQQAKMNAWSRILNHLRQTGMLLLDGNHSTPWYDRKYQDLTILVMSMGQPLGVDVLCNFFDDFVTEASENLALSPDEVVYITLASQRTLLLLLRNKFSNDERAVKVWLEVFPDLGCFSSKPVEWAEEFLQRRNPIPETLLIEGFVDLNCFQTRSSLALEEGTAEQIVIQDDQLPLHQRISNPQCQDDEQQVNSVGNSDALEEEGVKQPVIELIDGDDELESAGDVSDDETDEVVEVIDDDEYEEMGSERDDEMDEDDTEELEMRNYGEISNHEEQCVDVDDEHEAVTRDSGCRDEQELGSERDDEEMDDDDTEELEMRDHSKIKHQEEEYVHVKEEQKRATRDPGGGARHSEDDHECDYWNEEADEREYSSDSEESEMRESEESVVDDEHADESNDVIEILDDEEDEEMNDASGSMREHVVQSDDAAHEADVEHLDDDSDDQYGDDTADEGHHLPDAIPVNEEVTVDQVMSRGDPRQSKKERDAVARFEQGYEPDTAGGDISQAELQARLEKGYEPDAGSQMDDQEESGLEEIRQHVEQRETGAQVDQEFAPDTAGNRIAHAAMQARLEKDYESDARSQGDDQCEHDERNHTKEQKEAQARLEQGYEPDTAGGDISQAEMQDRLDQGYEPDTVAVYTEEEVSEAVPTEEEDNADEETTRAAPIKVNSISQSLGIAQKALCDHSGALSDDMDAADDRTEADHGAESSEVEENMSQVCNEAERVIPPAREASSTLVAFAYEAQIAPADMDGELATDLSRNTNENIFSPPVYRKVDGYPEPSRTIGTTAIPLGKAKSLEYLVDDLDGLSPGENVRIAEQGDGLGEPNCEVDTTNVATERQAEIERTELQVSSSTTSLRKELLVQLSEIPSARRAMVDRSFSTLVQLSASEMSEDVGEDETVLAPSSTDAVVMNESDDGRRGVVDSDTNRLNIAKLPETTKSPVKDNHHDEEHVPEALPIVDLLPQQAQKPTLNRGMSTAAQATAPPTTDDDSDVGVVVKTASCPSNNVDSNMGLVRNQSIDCSHCSEESKEHVLFSSLRRVKKETVGDDALEPLEDHPEEIEGDSEPPDGKYVETLESGAKARKPPSTGIGMENDEEALPRTRGRVPKKAENETSVTRKRVTRSRATVPGDDEEVQEKPLKRGRASTKEVTQIIPSKQRRGETIKAVASGDDGKVNKNDDQPQRRGDRRLKTIKDEEAPTTNRRSSRARETQLDDKDRDGRAKPKKRGLSALTDEGGMKDALRVRRGVASNSIEITMERHGHEPYQEDQKPKKRGRTAVERIADAEPEAKRGRGRAEEATGSTKVVMEVKTNELSPRKTRGSRKATSDQAPVTRRSAAVRATDKKPDKNEEVVPVEPRTTRGANKVRGRATPVMEEDRPQTRTTRKTRKHLTADDDASASASTRSKRSDVAGASPAEVSELPTRRSTRPRKAVNRD